MLRFQGARISLRRKSFKRRFKENEYYDGLVSIILTCLSELEPIRYRYRKQQRIKVVESLSQ